ncbi:hypothetical protein AX16_006366 [Volvariella volvacea WC 439]|nr:hypothetical protein AX16_006366 [Volvariella volvacea WC 439]
MATRSYEIWIPPEEDQNPEPDYSSPHHQQFTTHPRPSRARDPFANSNFFQAPSIAPPRRGASSTNARLATSRTTRNRSPSPHPAPPPQQEAPLSRPQKYSRAPPSHQHGSSEASTSPSVGFEHNPPHSPQPHEGDAYRDVVVHVPYQRRSSNTHAPPDRSTASTSQVQPEPVTVPNTNPRPSFSTVRDRSSSSASPIQKLERGDWLTVWHAGTSQYLQASTSACGLAAMNCGRMAVVKEQNGLRFDDLVSFMMEKETMTEILSICPLWVTPAHLTAEDIYRMPYFQSVLHTQAVLDGPPNDGTFRDLLKTMQRGNKDQVSFALIIRPPEIVALLRFPTSSGSDVFAIFDSHPRPDHPEGAAIIFTKSRTRVSEYLGGLFGVDPALLHDPSIGWQSEMLGMCEAHILVAKPSAFEDQLPMALSALRAPALSKQDSLIMKMSVEALLCQKLLSDSEREQRKLEAEKRALEARLAREQQEHENMILSQTQKFENLYQETQSLRQRLSAKEKEDEAVDVLRVGVAERDETIQRERTEHSEQVAKLMERMERLKVKLDDAKARARHRRRSRGCSTCSERQMIRKGVHNAWLVSFLYALILLYDYPNNPPPLEAITPIWLLRAWHNRNDDKESNPSGTAKFFFSRPGAWVGKKDPMRQAASAVAAPFFASAIYATFRFGTAIYKSPANWLFLSFLLSTVHLLSTPKDLWSYSTTPSSTSHIPMDAPSSSPTKSRRAWLPGLSLSKLASPKAGTSPKDGDSPVSLYPPPVASTEEPTPPQQDGRRSSSSSSDDFPTATTVGLPGPPSTPRRVSQENRSDRHTPTATPTTATSRHGATLSPSPSMKRHGLSIPIPIPKSPFRRPGSSSGVGTSASPGAGSPTKKAQRPRSSSNAPRSPGSGPLGVKVPMSIYEQHNRPPTPFCKPFDQ